MTHERIFKLEDGSRVKVVVNLITDRYAHRNHEYKADVYTCGKGKRTWKSFVDTNSHSFRMLSMEDRRKHINEENKKFHRFVFDTKIELWEMIKPKIEE